MVSVIIAAAGSGSRMNSDKKKQFISLMGRPVLVHTIRKFHHKAIDEIIVVTGEEDIQEVEQLNQEYGLNINQVVAGGARRQDSIYNALQKVNGDIVLIHDAARPFITEEIIQKNIEEVSEIGVITAVPCKDTIKVVSGGFVKETLERATLVNVQTPQSFKTSMIKEAYDYVNEKAISVTDDASVYEAYGKQVKIIDGSYDNIKLTTPEDLVIGEMILSRSKDS